MKVGIFLATQFTPGTDVAQGFAQLLEQVRVARQSGFASVWAAHHLLVAPVQMLQPMPLLARLLPEAEGMVIGPNIIILPLLNPVHVAEEGATMDLLSDGNFVLGVGQGYRDEEFASFGISPRERVGRFTKGIEVIQRLWTEERVTFHGQHYTLNDVGLSLRPVQKPRPPIWTAAVVEPAIKRVARIGDTWMITGYPTLTTLQRQMQLYREALQEVNKPVPAELPAMRECYVSSNHRRALEECRGPLEYKYRAYASWGQDRILPEADRFDQPFEDLVRDRFLIGDKTYIQEELLRYKELIGVNHFVMRVQWPGLEQEKVLHTIESLGHVVRTIG